ncbi:MAG TPA: SPOR domain-containing protein [Gemmatimonadales bacterium]|nr:SPOR domain-containing protein [Gemmatimonadales bacterium]
MVSRPRSFLLLPVLLAAFAACGRGGENPVHQALAQQTSARDEPAVAFRLATGRSGGDTRLYALPGLDEAAWRFRTPNLRTERIIGFSQDQDQVYLLGAEGLLQSLDLSTGRARVVDSLIATAALGPTGRLHVVREDGAIGVLEHRTVTWWSSALPQPPAAVFGVGAGRLVAVLAADGGQDITVLNPTKVLASRRVPRGPVAVSLWGELAAVGTDSTLMILDPTDTVRATVVRLEHAARAVAFSPAGHRIYLGDAGGNVLTIDALTGDVLRDTRLPGAPTALRLDPLGRTLLARPGAGDSLWVLELAELRLTGSVPGAWRDDLPAVATDGTLLVARGADVLSLAPETLRQVGRISGAGRDQWLAAAWDPRRPSLQLAADTAPRIADPDEQFFVQVSSTANEAWAEDLARNLRAAGMQAGVLPPSVEEDRYRVVLGPFPTREAAEATGRKLGRPYWIFTRTREPTARS